MRKATVIARHTPPEVLDEWFRRDPCFGYAIDKRLSPGDLLTLIERGKGYKHWTALLEVVAYHPAADDSVFDRMLQLTHDSGVMNSIATSGKASELILRRLKRSRHASVREHAAIALKRIEMARANDQQWLALFRKHSGDSSFDLAVRSIMPYMPGIPKDILQRLAMDNWTHIRLTAQQKLRERRSRKNHSTVKNGRSRSVPRREARTHERTGRR